MQRLMLVLVVCSCGAVRGSDRTHPDFPAGVQAMKAARWSDALRTFEGILRVKPKHHEARNNCAVCLIKLGRYEEAEKHLHQVLADVPQKAGSRLNLGVAVQGRGDTTDALKQTDTALDLRRKQYASAYHLAEACYNRGWLLDEQGRYEEAAAALREAVGHRVDHGKAWLTLAIALAELRQFPEARRAFDTASHWKDTFPDLPALIERNRPILDAAEKSPPPAPVVPPPTPSPVTTPVTPSEKPARTWVGDGVFGRVGLWDRAPNVALGAFAVLAVLLVLSCHLLFREHFRPPLSEKERETAVGWTVILSAGLFLLAWGASGCFKWVILVGVAIAAGAIIEFANRR